jgi:hypothetical protein
MVTNARGAGGVVGSPGHLTRRSVSAERPHRPIGFRLRVGAGIGAAAGAGLSLAVAGIAAGGFSDLGEAIVAALGGVAGGGYLGAFYVLGSIDMGTSSERNDAS